MRIFSTRRSLSGVSLQITELRRRIIVYAILVFLFDSFVASASGMSGAVQATISAGCCSEMLLKLTTHILLAVETALFRDLTD